MYLQWLQCYLAHEISISYLHTWLLTSRVNEEADRKLQTVITWQPEVSTVMWHFTVWPYWLVTELLVSITVSEDYLVRKLTRVCWPQSQVYSTGTAIIFTHNSIHLHTPLYDKWMDICVCQGRMGVGFQGLRKNKKRGYMQSFLNDCGLQTESLQFKHSRRSKAKPHTAPCIMQQLVHVQGWNSNWNML